MVLKLMNYNDTNGILNTLKEYEFPYDVLIETTAYCNLQCSMCPQKELKRKKGEISFPLFKKIVNELILEKWPTRLWLAIMGESLLLGDKIIEMISYAKSKGIQSINLNTNGTLLNEIIARKLLQTGLDHIYIGLDAFTEKSYNLIRIGGNFNTTIKNINRLLKLKEDDKSFKTEIIIQIIRMNENENEIEDFIDFWTKRNATVKIKNKGGWGKAISASNLTLSPNIKRYPCPVLIRECSILWDGTVINCSCSDFEGSFSAGNVIDQTIKEIWNNELKKRRAKHWSLDFSHPLCTECKDWFMGMSEFHYPKTQG